MKKCTDHRSRVVTARLAAMRAIHPGGVLPHGNALVVSPEDARARRDRRRDGLGTLAALDDAPLLDVCDKLSRDLEGARALGGPALRVEDRAALSGREGAAGGVALARGLCLLHL